MDLTEIDKNGNEEELRRVARMIREMANTLETEWLVWNQSSPRELDQVDGEQDQVDSETLDPKAFIEMIRKAANVLLNFLDTKTGAATATLIAENYKGIFTVLKRFSEVLGPSVMLFSIAAGLCYYDRHILRSTVRRFNLSLQAVDNQVLELMKSLKIIGSLMEQVTQDVQSFITERVSGNAEQINEIFGKIREEQAVAEIRLKAAEELLKDIEAQMTRYRNALLLKNAIVAASYGAVLFWMFKRSYINHHTASVGIFAGAVPFCYSYFSLSVDVQNLLFETKRREMKNLELKKELEVFNVRMKAKEENRAPQGSIENHSESHVR